MMARFIFLSFFMLVGALAPTKAQNSFPYPALPDSLRSVEQRATYLSEHYWDNFNFSDTLELANKEMAETKAAVVAMTPMLKQFYELKGKHPDAVLLFRCGDFYETYSQDAEKASKILGITLTKSSHTKDAEGKPLAMAGFPYHALDTYLPKLIRAGERVAICDQLEAPKRATEEISPSKVENPQQEQNNSSGIHR